MSLARVQSESALAAYLFHGWTISSVHRDPASGVVAEHSLEWTLPEHPRTPSSDEICRFVHLSDVEDIFTIHGRGVVIAPGLPRHKAGIIKHGDFVVLHDYAKSAVLVPVGAIELSSPPSPRGWGILFTDDDAVPKIRIGMQLWVRDISQSEQGDAGSRRCAGA